MQMRTSIHLFLATILGMGATLQAATYYVDQTAGNDANNGSQASPWKNCPGMASFSGSGSLQAGDTVMFDRGDTWLVTGSQGLYLTGGVTYIGNSWGTGTAKAIIRANANLSAGVVRFRDHATSATVLEGFNIDANSKVTNGVDINHSFWSLMNRATKRVKDCEVHHIGGSWVNGDYNYGLIISNHGGTGGYAENVEIINTKVHDTARDGLCLYPGDENADCRIKNILVRNCEVYNTGQDPNYGAGAGILVKGYVVDATIENCYVYGTKGASMFINGNEDRHYTGIGPTNIHIRNSIFTNNTAHGAIRLYDGSSGKDPKDVKIYGNIVYNSTNNGGFQISTDLGNTNKLWVYNNTFYNAPVIITNSSATFSPFEFKNNIVYYPGGTAITGSSKFTASSNNLTTNPSFKNTGSLPTGFTGTFGVNMAPNTDGLSLQSGSPAINAGTALTSPYNSSVNSLSRPQGSSWDIGAYEYGVTGTSPVAPTGLRLRGGDGSP